MDFLTVIVRVRNEPFLPDFLDYYLSEGASKIYVLDDESDPAVSIPARLQDRVLVRPAARMAQGDLIDVNELYAEVRNDSEWFALIDADEFVTTRKHPTKTISETLRDDFACADCVKVPWVMMACNGREQDPHDLLSDIVDRWNHDLRHPHPHDWHKGRCRFDEIEVKCFFRGASFSRIENPHFPAQPAQPVVCVESVRGTPSGLDPFFRELREEDIASGYLLCYHYRIISRQSCRRKTETSRWPQYRVAPEVILAGDYAEVVDQTMGNKWNFLLRHEGVSGCLS